MLSNAEFIKFILNGVETRTASAKAASDSALPEGFDGFDTPVESTRTPEGGSDSFARRLLEASGFGYAELVQRESVIRSTDAVARYLPERASYWPAKTGTRPFQTLLFEASLTHRELLAIPAFRSRALNHLDIVEDALARLVSEALDGFQRGGESVTADVRKGRRDETLCIISIIDEREGTPVRLVCFGTQNKKTEGLETFQITEQTRFWDPQLAREHLGLLYERQFKKLSGPEWQDAFTTTEERKQAERLLEVCTRKSPAEKDIQESVLDLLDMVAKGFGLRKRPNAPRRLQAFALPPDHDIGIDPEELEGKHGGVNPFGGVTLRDDRNRLLGYIVYPLKTKADADRLRRHLSENNRFHNVLVVYPDANQARLELWQGSEQLTGRLRRGQGYRDAADVVNLLSRFFVVSKAKVRNPTELAQELAYRARYLHRLALKQLEDEAEKGPLRNLYNAFKEALVHDQSERDFADAFAQTLTYGLLTARWLGNDALAAAGERLTRQTALKHLPAASPFLNDLFRSALSVKLDEQRGRLLWLVDDIADLLDRIDVAYVFGIGDKDSDTATDPVIHFYEPFLAAYNKDLKNKRGVFFTPRPVVSFIVRSVHELLQKEFGLEDGLASTETWSDVATRIKGLKIPEGAKATDPFVCILDPATGTGTFLFECIAVIERTMKARWCRELKKTDPNDPAVAARWSEYVPKHLLPRIVGYELMIASYAVAHLKLSFKLNETGYAVQSSDRIPVFLTNALDPPTVTSNPKLADLFSALSREAQSVNQVKRERHFSVVVGNPPYSLSSANLEPFHRELVERYKFIDGKRMEERGALQMEKILNDDYVKFLSLAERTLLRNGVGVFGLITNHAYLDNPTMRGMRHHFLSSFDKLWMLDLGGSAKKATNLANDGNVFDIQQGVAISVGVRSGSTSDDSEIAPSLRHGALSGTRAQKYDALTSGDLSLCSVPLSPQPELFLLVPTDLGLWDEYKDFSALDEIFPLHSIGAFTSKDHFVIGYEPQVLAANARNFRDSKLSDAALCRELGLNAKKAWNVGRSRAQIRELSDSEIRKRILAFPHRPFDNKYIFYHRSLVWSMAYPVNKNLLGGDNLALVTSRQLAAPPWKHVFCSNTIVEMFYISNKTKEGNHVFPLFVVDGDDDEVGQADLALSGGRRPNVNRPVIEGWSGSLALSWSESGRGDLKRSWGPVSLFEYVYGVLHSPEYRSRYEEFLVRAFPRVPRPRSVAVLRELADLGRKLIEIHLPTDPESARSTRKRNGVEYRGAKNTTVGRGCPRFEDGKVVVAEGCWFSGVPKEVWEWRVGVYQPCKKWLGDRSGPIGEKEIGEFQHMVGIISSTIACCNEVDAVVHKHGGWPGAFRTTARDRKE